MDKGTDSIYIATVLFAGIDEKFAITEELAGLCSMKGHPISK
jgi:hypothetical protein